MARQFMSATLPTLLDIAKRTDPNGVMQSIVELLSQTNPILEDMVYQEANGTDGHTTTIRTGLPDGVWLKYNKGIPPAKSTTAQVVDTMGRLGALAQVDKALADKNGNAKLFRLSEDSAFRERLNQMMAEALFYGDTMKTPERFTGLSPRYSTIDPKVPNSRNVLDAGGKANANQSIWFVTWGGDGLNGIYPKGANIGLQHTDKGVQLLPASDGSGLNEYYVSIWNWVIGLTIKDWRRCGRIANIDLATTKTFLDIKDESPFLPNLMSKLLSRIEGKESGRGVWYMSKDMFYMLSVQRTYATMNSSLSYEDVGGRMVPHFRGFPIREVDVLNVDEANLV